MIGIKFVVNKEGKLLPVDPIRPESLPSFSVPLKTSVNNTTDIDINNTNDRKKKKKIVRVAGSPATDLYFTPASTLATSLAGGGQIAVINPGVSIQNGESLRSGDTFPNNPLRANRKEYLRTSSNNASGFNSNDNSYIDSRSALNSPASVINSNINMNNMAVNDSFYDPEGSQDNTMNNAFFMPDIDAFEGSRRVEKNDIEDVLQNINNDDDILFSINNTNNNSIASFTSMDMKRPNKQSDKQKLNISLLSGGLSLAGNRDRISPVHTKERTKLPSPPFGQTTGHGLLVNGNEKHGGLGSTSYVGNNSSNIGNNNSNNGGVKRQ